MRVLIWLLMLGLTAMAQEPGDVESTLHPLTVPAPVTLEKLDLDFDFRSSSKPGVANVHLDARLVNPRSDAQDVQLMLVTSDSAMQLRWQGSPQDSQRLAVPFPTQSSRAIPVALLRLILLGRETGHLSADFRLRSLAGADHTWEFRFRLPDKSYWNNLGPAVVLVRALPGLEIRSNHALKPMPDEVGGTLAGVQITPFHPRELRLVVRWLGPPPELTVCVATTLAAWLGLLLTLPLAGRLGRFGAFLAAGLLTLGGGYGARTVIERERLLLWTTPAGSWSELLPPLMLCGALLSGLAAAWWAGGNRKPIQVVERPEHA